MLERVYEVAVERRLEQLRHMPDPQRDGVNDPGGERVRQHAPDAPEPHSLAPPPDQTRAALGHRPEERDHRAAQHDERRGDEHQEFMLRHVCREEHFAQRVQRADERDEEHEPSARVTQRLPLPDAAASPGPAPEPPHAAQVEPARERETRDDQRVESPLVDEVAELVRLAVVRERRG